MYSLAVYIPILGMKCIYVAIISLSLSLSINILNSQLEGVVLDNRYYEGSCLPHYIQNTRFRKPYNLQQYTLQVAYIFY